MGDVDIALYVQVEEGRVTTLFSYLCGCDPFEHYRSYTRHFTRLLLAVRRLIQCTRFERRNYTIMFRSNDLGETWSIENWWSFKVRGVATVYVRGDIINVEEQINEGRAVSVPYHPLFKPNVEGHWYRLDIDQGALVRRAQPPASTIRLQLLLVPPSPRVVESENVLRLPELRMSRGPYSIVLFVREDYTDLECIVKELNMVGIPTPSAVSALLRYIRA